MALTNETIQQKAYQKNLAISLPTGSEPYGMLTFTASERH